VGDANRGELLAVRPFVFSRTMTNPYKLLRGWFRADSRGVEIHRSKDVTRSHSFRQAFVLKAKECRSRNEASWLIRGEAGFKQQRVKNCECGSLARPQDAKSTGDLRIHRAACILDGYIRRQTFKGDCAARTRSCPYQHGHPKARSSRPMSSSTASLKGRISDASGGLVELGAQSTRPGHWFLTSLMNERRWSPNQWEVESTEGR